MDISSPWWTALAGLLVGGIAGFCVFRARLCTFGALEDAMVGKDWRRMKVFALALGLAIAGTQALALAGILAPERTNYVPMALPWLGILLGGLLFGLGMALVGTCAFGSLVRLGSGDLRSLVVLMVFGAAAYATLRGVLSGFRVDGLERVALTLPAGTQADLPSLIGRVAGHDLRGWMGALAVLALILPACADRRLWRAPRLMTAGVVLGLGVVAGWLATTLLVDEFAHPTAPQSLTFVSPVARTLFGLLFDQASLAEFGAGSVFGVALGAFAAARRSDGFRWEAFDDPREMKRHLLGAVLMGMGGILCGGCTIGQGLTAGSLLALSWPLAVAGMVVGARLGIALLMEGSFIHAVRGMIDAHGRWRAGP
ncbi:YeeE/YedE family protein [Xanthobacter sp. DSM 14520]|uniref:YeeE/YedE family protein n=1 Tax=Xanthobacter autotrophicus (strain ATCC BAA-1158 / Py2) TaxID=78245 RepID=UPI00372C52E7